jgi:hypothetical protein
MGRGTQVLTGAGAALACLAMTAAPALADKFDYLSKGKSVDAGKRGTKKVMCKDGRGLVGGGVIDDATEDNWSRVVSLQPLDKHGHDPDHVTDDGFKASVDNVGASALHMKTWAICAKHKVAKHLIYRSAKADPTTFNDALVSCPNGSRVVSGGGAIPGGFDESVLHSSEPTDGPDGDLLPDDGWNYFTEVTGSSRATAYVVCAKGKFAKGLHYKTTANNIGPDFGFLQANCDNDEGVLGGGEGGTDIPIVVFPSDDGPADTGDPGSLPDNGWISHASVPNSPTPFAVYAICHS